jgi:hypothetical protein
MRSEHGVLTLKRPLAVQLHQLPKGSGCLVRDRGCLGFQVLKVVHLGSGLEVLDPITDCYPTGLFIDAPMEWRQAALLHIMNRLRAPHAMGLDLHALCLELTQLDADWFSSTN